jgi:hypothetical protein
MWVRALFALAALSGAAQAYLITVDAHAEECFFDKVEAGTKMGKIRDQHLSIANPSY